MGFNETLGPLVLLFVIVLVPWFFVIIIEALIRPYGTPINDRDRKELIRRRKRDLK